MALSQQDIELIREVVQSEVRSELVPVRADIKDIRADVILVREDIKDIRKDIDGLREQIQGLTITLDKFLKRLIDHEDEFKLLKADVDQIKKVLKDKLGVEISIQGI